MKTLLRTLALAGLMAQAEADVTTDLINLYEFNGDFTDTLGNGLALVPNNVTTAFFGSGLWTWSGASAPGTGLILNAPASIAGTYSIAIRFEFSEVTGFRKVVDYQNQASDSGFYLSGGIPYLYPGAIGTTAVPANTFVDLVLTRDGADSSFKTYVNGNQTPEISYTDSVGPYAVATLVSGNAQFRFFQNDIFNSTEFSSGGTVSEIRVWDAPLAPSDIPNAFTVTPEPSAPVMFGLGLLGLAACRLRKRLA